MAVERFIYSSKLTDGLIAYVRAVGKPRRYISGMNCDRSVQFISLSVGFGAFLRALPGFGRVHCTLYTCCLSVARAGVTMPLKPRGHDAGHFDLYYHAGQ